jgi:CheY-like chemotaxis protein
LIAGRKLLVADDSPAYRKLLDLTFTDEGMEVMLADDGREAWGILEQFLPDLVVADVFMPQFSGYELCKLIKQDERFARIPVILLVGLHEPFDEAEARRAGADDVVTKPFQSIRSLVSRVGSLLGGKAESEPQESGVNEYSTLGLTHPDPSPDRAAPDEAALEEASLEETPPEETTLEPNVTVFVEAAQIPEMEAPEAEEPAGSTCPPDLELQTADTMQMERIEVEPQPPIVEASAYGVQDETAEMPTVLEIDEREDSSVVLPISETAAAIGAPGMNEHATPQYTPAPGSTGFDEGLLDLGDFASPPPRAVSEDLILDLDYEEQIGKSVAEPRGESGAQVSQPVTESAFAFESISAEVPAYETAPEAAYQEWSIVTPVETPEAVEVAEAPVETVAPVAVVEAEPTLGDANLSLSPEAIDAIARRTVEHLSERIVREIAWEVVPELAELLIKKKLEEEKS